MFFLPSFRFSLRLRVLLPAHLFPEVAVLAIEPEVVFVVLESAVVSEVAVLVAEPRVFAPVSVAGPEAAVAGSQASAGTAVAAVVLVPVSPVVVEVDSPGRPRSVAFPMSILLPAPPVSLKLVVRYRSVVPPTPVPITVSVVSSPIRIYIIIKTWNIVIMTPAPVIIL